MRYADLSFKKQNQFDLCGLVDTTHYYDEVPGSSPGKANLENGLL